MLKRGVRTTLLVTERFIELARATFESRDLPNGPMILLPRTEDTEYSDRLTMERICDETFRSFLQSAGVGQGREVTSP